MEISELADRPTGFDQLVGFETILDKIEKEGKVISVPSSKLDFRALSEDEHLYKYLWNRLYQLGYLSSPQPLLRRRSSRVNRRRQYNKPKLKSALREFQKDANITNDGWLGLQTWEALQQLYTFDEPTEWAKWLVNNKRAALHRSIELRLRVLGIVKDRKNTVRVHQVNRVSGMDVFKSFLLYLKAVPESVGELELLSYLYDFDKLTPLLYANYDKIIASNFEFKDSLLHKVLAIELWLHGFDGLEPGTQANKTPITYNGDDPISKAARKLCNSEDLLVTPRPIQSNMVKVCLQYFAEFEIGDLQAVQSEKVVEAIREISNNEEHAKALSKQINQTSWGAWLFDGIKRAFRWAYRQLQKGYKWLSEKIESLAIAIKKLSLPVVSFYRRCVKTLSDGLSVFTNKVFEGSTTQYAIYRDCDFDFKVFIANTAPPAKVQRFLAKFNAIWKQVYKMMAIALILVHIIKEALKLASAPIIGVPFVIAKFYKLTYSTDYIFIKDAFATQA
jgi:hypothetical protein